MNVRNAVRLTLANVCREAIDSSSFPLSEVASVKLLERGSNNGEFVVSVGIKNPGRSGRRLLYRIRVSELLTT